MIKKISFILILFSFCFQAKAQKFITNYEEKTFNWGGKIGLNAAIPIVESITINGIEMENINQQYKVGYEASIFGNTHKEKSVSTYLREQIHPLYPMDSSFKMRESQT